MSDECGRWRSHKLQNTKDFKYVGNNLSAESNRYW